MKCLAALISYLGLTLQIKGNLMTGVTVYQSSYADQAGKPSSNLVNSSVPMQDADETTTCTETIGGSLPWLRIEFSSPQSIRSLIHSISTTFMGEFTSAQIKIGFDTNYLTNTVCTTISGSSGMWNCDSGYSIEGSVIEVISSTTAILRVCELRAYAQNFVSQNGIGNQNNIFSTGEYAQTTLGHGVHYENPHPDRGLHTIHNSPDPVNLKNWMSIDLL